MKKILTVIGARPQFIKAACVSRTIAGQAGLHEVLVHTGQHFDDNMSQVFFEELEIPLPEYNLGVAGGTHGAMTGRMLGAIEDVLMAERPDCVLVYGDTNSTIAGALAAAKLDIPSAHVEAGLRSFNRRMPEEINRVLTDHLAHWLFSPTLTASKNLGNEGISPDNVHQSGDVMYDAALYYAGKVDGRNPIHGLEDLGKGEYVLATIHRQENTDDPILLKAILDGLKQVSTKLPVVLPLHPRTRQRLDALGIKLDTEGVIISPPVGYLDMMALERNAAVIATDSGGVQKEAYFHQVPCVTLRDETEWVELVELGWNRLAPPGSGEIGAAILAAMGTRGASGTPYGDGNAATKIIKAIQAGMCR